MNNLPQNNNVDKVLTPETRNFLSHLWRGGAHGYFWFAPHDGQKYTQWTPTNTIPEPLPRWKAANTYFGVHPSNQRGTDSQRGKIETISAVNALYAEFDAKDFGDKPAIIAHLEKLPLPPSVLIDSGGGHHAYWLLSDGYRLTDDTTRQHAQRVQRAWVNFVGGDPNATDLARVLRLPGTRNLKPQYGPDYPHVRYVECCLNRLYPRNDLEQLIAPLLQPKPVVATPVAHRNSAPGYGNGANHRVDAYAQTALHGELDELARTSEGNRNGQLNTASFNLGLLVKNGLLDANDVTDQLVTTAIAIGLGEREARATVRSGLDAGMRSGDRRLPDFTDSQQPQRPIVGGVAPVAAAPDDEQQVEQARRFQFLDIDELFNLPPRRMLVNRLLGCGETAMMFAAPNKGKSFVAIDLALCGALGQDFAGYFEIDAPFTVAYVTGEGRGGIPPRFKAAIAAREVDRELLKRNLTVSFDMPNLFEPGTGLFQFADDYRATRGEKLDLLIIDTLHNAATGSNENDQRDTGKVLDSIRFLQKALGCAVLLIHHSNKAGGYRGSTAYEGAMDMIIEIATVDDKTIMRGYKAKDDIRFAPIAFSLVAKEQSARVFWEGFVTDTAPQGDGDERQAQSDALAFFQNSPSTKFKCSTIGEATGRTRQAAQQLCYKLYKRGELQRETDPNDGKTLLYWLDGGASASGCK